MKHALLLSLLHYQLRDYCLHSQVNATIIRTMISWWYYSAEWPCAFDWQRLRHLMRGHLGVGLRLRIQHPGNRRCTPSSCHPGPLDLAASTRSWTSLGLAAERWAGHWYTSDPSRPSIVITLSPSQPLAENNQERMDGAGGRTTVHLWTQLWGSQ